MQNKELELEAFVVLEGLPLGETVREQIKIKDVLNNVGRLE